MKNKLFLSIILLLGVLSLSSCGVTDPVTDYMQVDILYMKSDYIERGDFRIVYEEYADVFLGDGEVMKIRKVSSANETVQILIPHGTSIRALVYHYVIRDGVRIDSVTERFIYVDRDLMWNII